MLETKQFIEFELGMQKSCKLNFILQLSKSILLCLLCCLLLILIWFVWLIREFLLSLFCYSKLSWKRQKYIHKHYWNFTYTSYLGLLCSYKRKGLLTRAVNIKCIVDVLDIQILNRFWEIILLWTNHWTKRPVVINVSAQTTWKNWRKKHENTKFMNICLQNI